MTNFYFLFLLMPPYAIFTGIAMTRYGFFDPKKVVSAFQREKLSAVGAFSASITHEIKNPLYVIQGLNESALLNYESGVFQKDSDFKAFVLDVLRRTSVQTARALEIIKNMKNLMKLSEETVPCRN